MNRKSKGSRNERKSRDLMRSQGYQVFKSGGSLGVFDLVCFRKDGIALLQVKSGRWPGGDEVDFIRRFECPPCCCRKLIHRWQDRKKEPDIRRVE